MASLTCRCLYCFASGNKKRNKDFMLWTPPINPDLGKLKHEYLEGLSKTMKLFSRFLGKRPQFSGDKITFADFLAYGILDLHHILECHECLDA
ncbi:hypothetical protein GH733_019126 [Mirounga leonina]|nr:hypothetical protein GH733_019126 [Mirounga leonina]